MQDVIPILALVVSVGALALSWAAFKVQRRRANMELARSLHFDLTVGEVAKARESLGTLTRDRKAITVEDPEKRKAWFVGARTDYFALLWSFERIWAGRVAIIADEGPGPAGPACRYLDDLIRWHVRNWAFDLPMIKDILGDELESPVEDGDSSKAFGRLSGTLLNPDEKSSLIKALADHDLEPVGYKEWQT